MTLLALFILSHLTHIERFRMFFLLNLKATTTADTFASSLDLSVVSSKCSNGITLQIFI
jgi:hypothetical protein